MRLPRVFVDADLAVGGEIRLDKARGHYLKNVLRLKPGAAFFLFDGVTAVDYRAILQAQGKDLVARIEAAQPLATESSLDCRIVQGLGRADHMDWMIQKTTELGVRRIGLFHAARSQRALKPAQIEKKLGHWRGVAISACEQCGRAVLPQIEYLPDLDSALRTAEATPGLLLDFNGIPLGEAMPVQGTDITIVLGPEGGLTEAEIELAVSRGYRPVRLGPRVLRTETAATAALVLLQSALGDLG